MNQLLIFNFLFLALTFKSNSQNINKSEYQNYRNIINELEKNPNSAISSIKNYSAKSVTTESKIYSNLLFGQYYYKINIDSSILYYNNAEKFSKQTKNDFLIGLSNIGKSSIKFAEGDFKGSLELYTNCLNVFKHYSDTVNLAKLYNNIGSVFQQTEQYDKAKEYFLIANQFYKKLKNLNGLGLNYRKLGYINFNQYQFKLARIYYDSAFYYFNLNNDKPGIASMYLKYGDLAFEENKNYKSALEYYLKAKEIYKSQNIILDNIFVSESIAEALFMMNKGNEAKNEILKAIQLAKANNYEYKVPDLYLTLYELYQIDNNYQNALEYFKIAQQYKDSIYKIENQNTINELEIKYKTSEKDNQILKNENELNENQKVIQNQKIKLYFGIGILVTLLGVLFTAIYFIRKQRKLNAELKNLNSFKNKIFTIISHDLRSPINSIVSHSKETSTQNKASNVLHILDNLLHWSYPQLSKNQLKKTTIILNEILEEVIQQTFYLIENKQQKIEIKIDENFTFSGDYDTTLIILRNLVTNASKYSNDFDTIFMTQTDKALIIKNKLSSNPDKGLGIGIKLCKDLALQNNYKLLVDFNNDVANVKLEL